jgi:hypothetical protein
MAYGCRPSQIVGIPSDWAAYQFDLAAYQVGQQALNDDKTKGRRGKNGRARRDDAQPMPSSVLRGLLKT